MIHYLILAHKDFQQVNLLINKLKTKNSKVYVHIDGKIKDFPKFENATLIKNRVKSNWGGFSLVKCELNGITEIYNHMKEGDHLIVISGQCWPIQKMEDIEKYINNLGDESCLDYESITKESIQKVDRYYFNDLNLHMPHLDKWLYRLINDKLGHNMRGTKIPMTSVILSYVTNIVLPRRKYLLSHYKLYKGGQWISISFKHIKWMMEFLKSGDGKKFYNSFKYTNCSDEIFFQTLLYNSPMKNEIRNETLRYIDWIKTASSPHILTIDYYDKIKKSGKLFARKFDINEDWKIINELEKENRQ